MICNIGIAYASEPNGGMKTAHSFIVSLDENDGDFELLEITLSVDGSETNDLCTVLDKNVKDELQSLAKAIASNEKQAQ
jgi:hypothetical protein